MRTERPFILETPMQHMEGRVSILDGYLTISGKAYDDTRYDDPSFTDGDGYEPTDRYTYDIDKIMYNGVDILPVIQWQKARSVYFMEGIEEPVQHHIEKLFQSSQPIAA